MDFQVPDGNLNKEEGLVDAPLTINTRKDTQQKTKAMTEFFRKHEVSSMISRLTGILIRDKPADPIAHIISHLVCPEVGVLVCADPTPHMDDAAAAYLLKHRVHYMFEEFLCNMVDDAPVDGDGNVDILGYAMSWMRWNKKRYGVVTC